jgi:protein-L-isoaspartate(D-aspartate) O-methyltransferase
MKSEAELADIRRAYARQILSLVGVNSPELENAFATVKREHYLGLGPWKIFRWTGYEETPDDDPTPLYDNVLVGIIPERGLNNGQPSGHAMWLAAAAPRPGEHVVHIGAGVGYYTAILAELVGSPGRVTAIEHEPQLAARARANLAHLPNVTVLQGDGAVIPLDPADVIYVNAGATRPVDAWLDALKEGGRLVIPLTTNAAFGAGPPRGPQGAMFRIERRGDEFHVSVVSGAAFIPGEGLRDPASEAVLAAGFARGGVESVTRLYRTDDVPEEQCWVRAPGWSLAYR